MYIYTYNKSQWDGLIGCMMGYKQDGDIKLTAKTMGLIKIHQP